VGIKQVINTSFD